MPEPQVLPLCPALVPPLPSWPGWAAPGLSCADVATWWPTWECPHQKSALVPSSPSRGSGLPRSPPCRSGPGREWLQDRAVQLGTVGQAGNVRGRGFLGELARARGGGRWPLQRPNTLPGHCQPLAPSCTFCGEHLVISSCSPAIGAGDWPPSNPGPSFVGTTGDFLGRIPQGALSQLRK